MVDFKDPKNQKLILVIIGFLIIAYGWYSQFYTKNNDEVNKLNSEYEALLAKLSQVEQKAKSLESLKAEYNELLISYRPMRRLLPDTLEFSTLLNQIHIAAQNNKSVVFEIIPRGGEEKEYYNSVFYGVKMATTFHDMGNFLAEVANFPFIVNVSKVISKTYEDQPKAPKVKEKSMMAEFVLTAYNAKPSANVDKKPQNPKN